MRELVALERRVPAFVKGTHDEHIYFLIERRPDGVFSAIEQQALVGLLGGYSGLTRDAYALDLRQFAAWCQQRQLALFDVARHDIES